VGAVNEAYSLIKTTGELGGFDAVCAYVEPLQARYITATDAPASWSVKKQKHTSFNFHDNAERKDRKKQTLARLLCWLLHC